MIARSNESGLELIRLDGGGDAVRHLPEEVRHAAEILVAYVAGLERGRGESGQVRPAVPRIPRQIPATDPADVPGQGTGDATSVRQQLVAQAERVDAEERELVQSAGAGVLSVACTIISGIATSTTPEVVLVWGADTYRKCSDQLR